MRFYVLAILMSLGLAGCSGANMPVANADPQEADTHIKAEKEAVETVGAVRHIGNAGLMIAQGETKILFDPLYRNGYNNYHLVPEAVKADVVAGRAPFDGISALLISHAHGDHFDAEDILTFHQGNPQALIIGPAQAIAAIEATGGVSEALRSRFVPMGLEYGADPLKLDFEGLSVEAVRIPHAGGPGRREIENLVYRVQLEDAVTVMHMGDADPALEFFSPYEAHWQSQKTDTAFPPYWFFLSTEGVQIIEDVLNTQEAIGVHVPVRIPDGLIASGRNFFGDPGGVRRLRQIKDTP